jgi:hypothetical protein
MGSSWKYWRYARECVKYAKRAGNKADHDVALHMAQCSRALPKPGDVLPEEQRKLWLQIPSDGYRSIGCVYASYPGSSSFLRLLANRLGECTLARTQGLKIIAG